jgi:peptide chain release factor 1
VTITTPDIPGFRHEAGGLRIQRVPETEKRGRVHSSTVTIAVLFGEQRETAYDNRREDDFVYRWYSGTGKGGQKRNKSMSCLEITHVPTGITRQSHGRSRELNAAQAMETLIAELDRLKRGRNHEALNDTRSTQVGSGMRGDKKRTIRFQDDQIVDHITGRSCKASMFMKGNIELLW